MADGTGAPGYSDGPRLIAEMQTSTLAGRRFTFTPEELRRGVLLGRAADCKLRFNPGADLKVSGHHALLIETRKGIFVRDKGSSNGVYVNGKRVPTQGTRLYDGAEVRLGQEGALLLLRIPGETAPESGSRQVEAVPEPSVGYPNTQIERRPRRGLLIAVIVLLAAAIATVIGIVVSNA